MRLDPSNPDDRRILARVDGGRLLAELDAAGLPPREPPPAEDGEKKGSKYRNTRIQRGGEWFDSVWEWECWAELGAMQRAGEIDGLRRQVRYDFAIDDPRGEPVKVGWWTADFVFRLRGDTEDTVADAKHRATAAKQTWPRTRKLMRALHGVDVLVIYKGERGARSAALQRAAERGLM